MTNREYLFSDKITIDQKKQSMLLFFEIADMWYDIWIGVSEEMTDMFFDWLNINHKEYNGMSLDDISKDFKVQIEQNKHGNSI